MEQAGGGVSGIALGIRCTRVRGGVDRIEQAEESLARLGFAGEVRVRDQGQDLARIEVGRIVRRRDDSRIEIVDAMRDAGFRYVTLDLEGFRSGSHNLVLSLKRRETSER